MAQIIQSAYPHVLFEGINDDSVRIAPVVPENYPTHLPKVFLFAQRGGLEPQLVFGGSRSRNFGAKTFEERSKYATHATVLSNMINAQGNQQIIQRVVPSDIGPAASVRLYLEVVEGELNKYQREVDGSFSLSPDGERIQVGSDKVQGHKVRWVVKPITQQDGQDSFGKGTIDTGTLQLDGNTGKLYPIVDLVESSLGSDGNNTGFRMFAPTDGGQYSVKRRLIADDSFYPLLFGLVRRESEQHTGKLLASNSGAALIELSLFEDTFDSVAEAYKYAGDEFVKQYKNPGTDGTPEFPGYIGETHFYRENIELLAKQFYEAEKQFITLDGRSDFDGKREFDYRCFNFLSGVDSRNRPYETFELDSSSLRLTENTTIYLQGGTDGTLSYEEFNKAVEAELSKYADPNEEVYYNVVRHPESVFYDSGFPMATKRKFVQVLNRPDVVLVLSVYQHGAGKMSAMDQTSIAIALQSALETMPESEIHATPVARAIIVGRSGDLINSQYRDRLPLTLDIASKAARYMGAGDGLWDSQRRFDVSPANQVNLFTNIDITSTPAVTRIQDWDNGMIWVEDFTKKVSYYPSLHAVYKEDTSVLKSIFLIFACVDLTKLSYQLHREFTGRSDLTDAQFIDRVQKRANELVKDRYDDRFLVQPKVYITDYEKDLGFAWTTEWNVGANGSKTVQTLRINVKRRADMEASS